MQPISINSLWLLGVLDDLMVILIAACVLIVGLGLGFLWKRYLLHEVDSTKVITPWIARNDRQIFFDTALDGCYM